MAHYFPLPDHEHNHHTSCVVHRIARVSDCMPNRSIWKQVIMSRGLLRLLPRLASAGAVAGGDLSGAVSVFGRGVGAAVGRSFTSDADLLKTPLHDLHVEQGGENANMVWSIDACMVCAAAC